MTIYKDALTGDTLLNSSYEITEVNQGLIYQVGGESATNLAEDLKLMETSYSKKDFMSYGKNYVNKIAGLLAAKNPSRLRLFNSLASIWFKEVLGTFDDYRFYTGESFSEEGLVILRRDAENEGDPPRYYYLKDGLIAESV